jgi:hypothetical protein
MSRSAPQYRKRALLLSLGLLAVLVAAGALTYVLFTPRSATPRVANEASSTTKNFCEAVDGYYRLGRGDATGTYAQQVHTIRAQAGYLEKMAKNAYLPKFRIGLEKASKDAYILATDRRALAAFRAKNYNYRDSVTIDYNDATALSLDLYGPVVIGECHTLPQPTTSTLQP